MLGLWELAVPMTKTYLMGNQYLLSLLSHLVTDKTTFKYLQEDQKKPHIERHLFFLLTLLKKTPTNKKTPKQTRQIPQHPLPLPKEATMY